ncbi:hypothetical protein [Arthrobacter sp. ISL-69]|uniref:hypothetical protein n=1 Tax=Arthrobacter sp. ISL-69 TaxID=2819113 RepID=UPI001BE841B6|nr:hypothetical protein [Arthrobacter sp. ISL-69]MBT2539075.1 hypothetical protein [Arthrobacter sp. ISL-69]
MVGQQPGERVHVAARIMVRLDQGFGEGFQANDLVDRGPGNFRHSGWIDHGTGLEAGID